MPVTADTPAPYAPASAILDIIGRFRERGLPTPINAEVLGRAGITDSLIPRTLQALKTLDLLDDDEKPTQTLEGLRLAPAAEYQQRLVDWLNHAYADILNFVDPETADEIKLRDAFRAYNPVGQQGRMVTLFSGLYGAAGIGSAKPAGRRAGARTPGNNGSGSTNAARRAAPTFRQVDPKKPSETVDTIPSPAVPNRHSHGAIIAANEYQLVALLDPGMTDEEKKAVWTLLQYLKTKGAARTEAA